MEGGIQFTYIAIILWIGVYQGLILSPVLWFRKEGNELANKLLAIFLLVTSLRLLFSIYQFSGQTAHPNFWLLFAFPFTLLYGPLYYLYLKSYIEKSFSFSRKYLLHFIPPLLGLIFSILAFFFFTPEDSNLLELLRKREFPIWVISLPIIGVLQVFLYIFLGLRLIRKYYLYLKEESSFSQRNHIRWLTGLEVLLLLPVISVVLMFIISDPRDPEVILPIPALGVSFMLLCIGAIALVRPDFLQGLPDNLKVDKEEDLSPRRYESSSLLDENKERYHKQLNEYLHSQQAYLEQELTLTELANRLGINTKYLSQVINEVEGKNFMDYINHHRIERAKEMLHSPAYKYYTILAIAQEVGFKSKSAFYNAFKKFANMTPSAFRELQTK